MLSIIEYGEEHCFTTESLGFKHQPGQKAKYVFKEIMRISLKVRLGWVGLDLRYENEWIRKKIIKYHLIDISFKDIKISFKVGFMPPIG